jgi:Tfp pilus assembly protein PilP
MRSLVALLFGIYIGQEYGRLIPNLKNESIKLYEKLEHELNTFNEDVVRRQGNKK